MKLTKKDLTKLITEEINRLEENYQGGDLDTEIEVQEPAQQYVDWIVGIEEAAREAKEKFEDGEDPAVAAALIDAQYEKRPRETNPR